MSIRKGDKCRLCFASGIFHINIFDTSKNILEALQDLFHTEVNEYDSLPNLICVDCWLTLQDFHKFYRNVLAAQNKFLNDTQPQIKAEILSDPFFNENYESEGFVASAKFEQVEVSEIHLRGEEERNDFNSSREGDDSTHFDGIDMNGHYSDNDDYDSDDDNAEKADKAKIANTVNNDQKFDGDSSDSEFQPKEDSSDEDFVVKRSASLKRTRSSDIPPGKRKRGRPRNEVKALRKGPKGNFKCPHCDKWFTRRYRIDVHIKIKHGYQCDECEHRVPSELKLRQHKHTHIEGFGDRLRKNLEEVIAIDISKVEPEKAQEIWSNFNLTCEKCPTQFVALNEAQMHYPAAHDVARGYLRCCDLRMREEGVIKEHIAYHANPELYYCFVCDTTLKLKSYLRLHLKGHIADLLDNQTFKCDICFKVYASKANVESHKAEVHTHKADQIKCEICSKAFFNVKQRDKHMRNIHDVLSKNSQEYIAAHFNMTCDQCDGILESFQHARTHYLLEHGDPKGYLKCCDIKLRSITTITEHIEWHLDPNKMKCEKCNVTFKTRDRLLTHIRRHVAKYTCEVCGKCFKRRNGLRGHFKNKHQPKPRNSPCRFCSLRFVSDEKRDNHEQLIHYGNPTVAKVQCEFCGQGFSQSSHLSRHMEKYHSGKEVEVKSKGPNKGDKCTICGLWLSSRYRLKLHRKSHMSTESNKCQTCGVEAPSHEALLGHIRAFHEVRQKNKCRLCETVFETTNELQEHILSNHPTEKLYQCIFCSESFVWKVSLDAHIKKMHPDAWETDKDTKETVA